MKQGEIWSVYFDPVKGREQFGNRPALIISGPAMNENLDVLIACPLTSTIHNFQGNPIINPSEENGLSEISEVIVFHVRALSKERFKKRLGVVTNLELEKVKQTLNDILKY